MCSQLVPGDFSLSCVFAYPVRFYYLLEGMIMYNQKKEHAYGTNITEILFTISILHLGSFSTYKEHKQIMFNMFNTAIFQLL